MARYSIKDLEHLSNIKAHTLRVWEQRYNIIIPKRTSTNIRYYDDSDLRLILNIAFLKSNGHKISKIAGMTPEEIGNMVMKISDSNLEYPNQINAMVIAMVNLNEERFEKIISTNTLQFGFESTMLNIVYPFLNRIGILWQTGSINPAHEHFITGLIRQKLIVAIDGQLTSQNPQAKKYVLFLPEGELHEISLLFAAYIIKSRHNKVIYLGQNLPVSDLSTINDIYDPDYVFSVITTSPTKNEVIAYARELQKQFQDKGVLLSGHQVQSQKDKLPLEITVLDTIQDLVQFVDTNSQMPFDVENVNRISKTA
ncbi:MAG: MerR family transcriptional regulator [Bacteroidota bacterium]